MGDAPAHTDAQRRVRGTGSWAQGLRTASAALPPEGSRLPPQAPHPQILVLSFGSSLEETTPRGPRPPAGRPVSPLREKMVQGRVTCQPCHRAMPSAPAPCPLSPAPAPGHRFFSVFASGPLLPAHRKCGGAAGSWPLGTRREADDGGPRCPALRGARAQALPALPRGRRFPGWESCCGHGGSGPALGSRRAHVLTACSLASPKSLKTGRSGPCRRQRT